LWAIVDAVAGMRFVSGPDFTACGKKQAWLAQVSILGPGIRAQTRVPFTPVVGVMGWERAAFPNQPHTVSGHDFQSGRKGRKKLGL